MKSKKIIIVHLFFLTILSCVSSGNLQVSIQSRQQFHNAEFTFINTSSFALKPTIKFIAYDESMNTIDEGTIYFDEILSQKSQTKTYTFISKSKVYKIFIKNAETGSYHELIQGVHGATLTFTYAPIQE